MATLEESYLRALAEQIAFLSAVLGGFSITYLATIIGFTSHPLVTKLTVGGTALAACSFIIAVIGSVSLIVLLHEDAPAQIVSDNALAKGRLFSSLGFFLGIVSLLLSIGLSGWFRSKVLGIITSIIAFLSLLMVITAIIG